MFGVVGSSGRNVLCYSCGEGRVFSFRVEGRDWVIGVRVWGV